MAINSAANLLSVDSLFTTQAQRDEEKRESIMDIPLNEISDFPNHPFKVRMDESMTEMTDSVRQYGILVPGLVRPKPEGGYEMVAGHRRKKASELAGNRTIPCIVRELTDDEATIIMVDSNLQREQILPSEKAFAYKMNPAFVERKDLSERQAQGLSDVIDYAANSGKTQAVDEKSDVLRSFVSGVNCHPSTARDEMIAVKKRFGKEDGTVAYHGYQSFAPGEATPEIAHEIGLKLAQRLWGDRYQVLVTTHLDKESHLHNHFVLNTVSFVDGIKYHRTAQDSLTGTMKMDRTVIPTMWGSWRKSRTVSYTLLRVIPAICARRTDIP